MKHDDEYERELARRINNIVINAERRIREEAAAVRAEFKQKSRRSKPASFANLDKPTLSDFKPGTLVAITNRKANDSNYIEAIVRDKLHTKNGLVFIENPFNEHDYTRRATKNLKIIPRLTVKTNQGLRSTSSNSKGRRIFEEQDRCTNK